MSSRVVLYWLALLFLLTVGSAVSAEPFAIVVHPDTELTSITKVELSRIFLRRLRTWSDGKDARPVDQLPESGVRAKFTRLVHERNVVTIEVYWKRMIFSGRGVPPEELDNDDAVLEFVANTPGAVGYVSASAELESVRRLALEE